METELFLGGLTILTMAAIIIVALTTNKRSNYQEQRDHFDLRRATTDRRDTRR